MRVWDDFRALMRRVLKRDANIADRLPDFGTLIDADRDAWDLAALGASATPVLIPTSTGGHLAVAIVEAMLAASLRLRGADPIFLLCDGALPACQECDLEQYPSAAEFARRGPRASHCERCFGAAAEMYAALKVPVLRYSGFLTDEDRLTARELAESLTLDELRTVIVDGVSIGEHAYAGALRYFARGDLVGEPHGERVLRKYVEAAYLTSVATGGVCTAVRPRHAVFHHGIYVPQGLIGDVMRREGVHVVNWAVAYRKKCFIFSHDDTYHRTLMDEPTASWEDMPWGPEQEATILGYLRERWSGTSDWILVQHDAEQDARRIADEMGIDFSVPTVGLLTNVVWDAQLFYESNAFPDMLNWIVETIRYFETRTDLQLVIRVHPAELTGTLKTRQPVLDAVHAAFPVMPPNVFIVGPEKKLSTYAILEHCDAAIIYGTKTGVEVAAMGIPVIVAGEAWIRGKGITLDAGTSQEYFDILGRLPLGKRMSGEELERARRYAFHFFMRRMIPLDFMEPSGGWPPYELAIDRIGELGEGHSVGLDVICDGILKSTPFIYPAEVLEMPGARITG